MLENGPGKEPHAVGLEGIDCESKVVALGVGEGVVHLEAGEDGGELGLGERAHNGEDELKVLSQHFWLLGPKLDVLLISNNFNRCISG